MHKHAVFAMAGITLLAFAQGAHAQERRTPDDVPPVFDRTQDAPKSKSDAYRLVGKVLEIDQGRGTVKLATDEGERVVKPTPQLLAAIRVGDTISLPRAEDPPVSASPRTFPTRR